MYTFPSNYIQIVHNLLHEIKIPNLESSNAFLAKHIWIFSNLFPFESLQVFLFLEWLKTPELVQPHSCSTHGRCIYGSSNGYNNVADPRMRSASDNPRDCSVPWHGKKDGRDLTCFGKFVAVSSFFEEVSRVFVFGSKDPPSFELLLCFLLELLAFGFLIGHGSSARSKEQNTETEERKKRKRTCQNILLLKKIKAFLLLFFNNLLLLLF